MCLPKFNFGNINPCWIILALLLFSGNGNSCGNTCQNTCNPCGNFDPCGNTNNCGC